MDFYLPGEGRIDPFVNLDQGERTGTELEQAVIDADLPVGDRPGTDMTELFFYFGTAACRQRLF